MGVGTDADNSMVATTTLRVVAATPIRVCFTVFSVACACDVIRVDGITNSVALADTGGAELWPGGRLAIAVAAPAGFMATDSVEVPVPRGGALIFRLISCSAWFLAFGWNGLTRLRKFAPGGPTRGSRDARIPFDVCSVSSRLWA